MCRRGGIPERQSAPEATTVALRSHQNASSFWIILLLRLREIERAESALPPKADVCGAASDVRFGPKADIILLDHFVRPGEYCRRNCKTQCLRGLEIDDKFVLVRCLHWQVGRLLSLEDAIYVAGGLSERSNQIRTV